MFFVNSLLHADIIQYLISQSLPISYEDVLAKQNNINFMVRQDGCLNLSTDANYIKNGKDKYIQSYMLNQYKAYLTKNQKLYIFAKGVNNSFYTYDLESCNDVRNMLMGK